MTAAGLLLGIIHAKEETPVFIFLISTSSDKVGGEKDLLPLAQKILFPLAMLAIPIFGSVNLEVDQELVAPSKTSIIGKTMLSSENPYAKYILLTAAVP